MKFPIEYKWIEKRLRVAFPKFEVSFCIRDYDYTVFGFGIRDKYICFNKRYSIKFLKQRNAPSFVDKVINRWVDIIENSKIPRVWEESLLKNASVPPYWTEERVKIVSGLLKGKA